MNFEQLMKKGNYIKDSLINVRRDIHETPELAMEEYITKKKIKSYLDDIGIDYKEYSEHRGIMAQIIKDEKFKTI